MKNKGFTMVELLSVLVIIGILSTMTVVGVSGYLNNARKQTYKTYEDNMKRAAESYMIDNSGEIPDVGGSKKILAQTLVDDDYLDRIVDPINKEKNCNKNSYVIVKRRGNETDFNMTLDYELCLKCSDYTSTVCN